MQIFKNGQRIDTPDQPAKPVPEMRVVKRTVEVLTGSSESRVQSLAPTPETSGYASIEEYRERNS